MSTKILKILNKISLNKRSLLRDFEKMAVEDLKRIYDEDQNKAVQLLCKPVNMTFAGTYSGDTLDSLFKLNLKYLVLNEF